MRQTFYSNKFRKDFKSCSKRGWQMSKLQSVMQLIENDEELPATCRPHKLSGNYAGRWECHVAPDWLLIYLLDDDENTVKFERTDTHSNLF